MKPWRRGQRPRWVQAEDRADQAPSAQDQARAGRSTRLCSGLPRAGELGGGLQQPQGEVALGGEHTLGEREVRGRNLAGMRSTGSSFLDHRHSYFDSVNTVPGMPEM